MLFTATDSSADISYQETHYTDYDAFYINKYKKYRHFLQNLIIIRHTFMV